LIGADLLCHSIRIGCQAFEAADKIGHDLLVSTRATNYLILRPKMDICFVVGDCINSLPVRAAHPKPNAYVPASFSQ
jgi:hypothetical protein